MIVASVKSIMESTEKLCGGKTKLKVTKALFLIQVEKLGLILNVLTASEKGNLYRRIAGLSCTEQL